LRTSFGGAARSVLVPAAGAGRTGAGREVTTLPAASGAGTCVGRARQHVLKASCTVACDRSATTVFIGKGGVAVAGSHDLLDRVVV